MSTGTVRFHRVLRAAPERIYRAFLTPAAMAKWLPHWRRWSSRRSPASLAARVRFRPADRLVLPRAHRYQESQAY